MRRNLVALFISLSIHALILALLLIRPSSDLFTPSPLGSEQGQKINLKNLNFSSLQKDSTRQSIESQAQVESKKQTPQPQIKQTQKPINNNAKKPQKTAQTKQKAQQTQESKAQAESKKSEIIRKSPSIYEYSDNLANKEILELYGQEFGSLNRNQREFIKSNLDSIGKITQKYLKYPLVAGKIGQEGQNIVEFYLHPNGDISELKLLTSSGFRLLDDNSIHTIKIAYKDYPYPSEKTKIRIRVTYRIY